ncbi:MAG: nuclear transport factor 2 family protein [Gemmatimonadales bacterium]
MGTATQQREPATDWEQEIRNLEEQGRLAFLAGDTATLDAMWDDRLLVNSPLNMVNDKAKVLDLLGKGIIRHTMDEVTIEHIARYGDVVAVMGRDTVDGPPSNTLTHRRFTNIWQLQDGSWRMIARHAQVIAPR